MIDYGEVQRRADANAAEYRQLNADQWKPWGNENDAYTRSAESWWALFDGWGSWFFWGDELV
jgi:hypothetical protein